MHRGKKKPKFQTLKTLTERNKVITVKTPEQCNLLGVVKIGNKQIDLYDRVNICSPTVYIASKNLPAPAINPLTKQMAYLLTKIPNVTLKRLGNDILSAYKIDK